MFYRLAFLGLLVFGFNCLEAQDCNFEVSGRVIDAETGEGIPSANVYIKDLGKGTISNADGTFLISHICGRQLELMVSMIGYHTEIQKVDLKLVENLVVRLTLLQEELCEIQVSSQSLSASKRESQHLNVKEITSSANENLATMMESLSGVNALKTGSGIAKPVVQGVYGNRLPVIVNGVTQAGQQWGNDHSPEVDPLVANSISVLSGVDALQYQGKSLGSIVLVEPDNIKRIYHLNGKASYFLESNGWGNGVNLQLQKYGKGIAWKVNGTLKKSGDKQTADYYLTNTGVQEENIALQLEKRFNNQWTMEGYLSSFNSEIGILRGSHIGNLTDLEEAFDREEPFYTNDSFSYSIDAPRQAVNHHVVKLDAKHYLSDERMLNFTYAAQINNRREYDVRRGGRSDIPALSLLQVSHFFEAKYSGYIVKNWRLNTGIQANIIDNTNDPETGILPLIPDYFSFQPGVFVALNKSINKWQLNFGGRYDYQRSNVVAITNSAPREIVRYNNNFNSYKLASDAKYHLSPSVNFSGGLHFASRNPEVNELYSNGLHQGVGGIEEGDPNLKEESALKGIFNFNANVSHKLQFESSFYYQYVDGYIFLNPQDEVRLTIRGAFPVFKYEQTNASIYGLDLTAHYHLSHDVKFSTMYSYLKGSNLNDDVPLINMPSNNIRLFLSYNFNKVGKFENLNFELSDQYVFKQSNLLPEQDYVPVPDAYNLLGLKVSVDAPLKKSHLNTYLKVDNLLNVSYRDYMNRMRYFADDVGVNFVGGLTWNF